MEKKSKFKNLIARIGNVRLSQIWNKFRKPFIFCWKAGLAIFAVVFMIDLGEALIDTCKDHLGLTHYYWCDEDLGKNVEIRHFSNNQAATYNKITDENHLSKAQSRAGFETKAFVERAKYPKVPSDMAVYFIFYGGAFYGNK